MFWMFQCSSAAGRQCKHSWTIVFSFSFPLQPGTKQFPDKLYVFSKGTRNYKVTGTNLMLHTILRENDSMGHTLTVNGNEEPGKQTQKHLKRIVQVGTQRTLQVAASSWSFSFQLLQFTHSLNYCLKNWKEVLIILNSLSMLNEQKKKKETALRCNNFEWANQVPDSY